MSKEYCIINELLEKLELIELEIIQKDIVYTMIRRKTFNNATVKCHVYIICVIYFFIHLFKIIYQEW